MLKMFKSVIKGSNNAESYIEQGKGLSKAGQKQEAIAAYDKAISINPNDAACLL